MAFSELEYLERKYTSVEDEDSCVMVAAIDFGTTYSGYGFSFKTSPTEIIANKNWGDELSRTSYKAPTSVLVDDQAQFVSFGYEAEHQYSQLCVTEEGKGYDLYRHFKMMLYHKRVSMGTLVQFSINVLWFNFQYTLH